MHAAGASAAAWRPTPARAAAPEYDMNVRLLSPNQQ
jgi:hypothetical protein